MAAILILSAFLLIAFGFLCCRGTGLGESSLKAALLVLLVIAVSTEILSLFRAVSLAALVILWLSVNLCALGALPFLARRGNGAHRALRKLRLLSSRAIPTRRAAVFATLTAVVVLLTFVTALLQFPYDADSVAYHMPRVAHWIQERHVGFYPTVNQRQNFFAPLSSYAVLHVQLLSGTDRFSVFPQYAGMLLSLTLVAKLAAALGLGATGRWFAATAAATLPMLIAQSHCNQNDLVLSALMLGFAWLLLRTARRSGAGAALWCSLAFGLAVLTKGTAVFYGAAIGGTLGLYAVLRTPPPGFSRWRTACGLAAAAVLGAAFLLPFAARCQRDPYTYLRNEYTAETRTERLGVDILSANAIRNAAMHAWLPAGDWNDRLAAWVRERVGTQDGNMESSFRAMPFQLRPPVTCFYVGSPVHLAAALLALLLLPLARARPRGPVLALALASVAAALLFNLLLKWQYWGMRLQLPWFLLTTPLVAFAAFRLPLPRLAGAAAQTGAAIVLFVAALPALLFDHDVPLWQTHKPPLFLRDAASIRFNASTSTLGEDHAHQRVVAFLRTFDPDEVGLIVPRCNASVDYHWWVAFGTHARPGRPRLRHVASDAWPGTDAAPPEFVIADRRSPTGNRIRNRPYEVVHQEGRIRVYRRAAQESGRP